jgi:hypothetical protein
MIGPTPNSSRLLEQVAAPAADDGQDRLLPLACLLHHGVRATSQGAQRDDGAGRLDVPRWMDAQHGGSVEHRGEPLATEPDMQPDTDRFRRGDHETEHLQLRLGGGMGGGIDR